jgi:hypothetical protein
VRGAPAGSILGDAMINIAVAIVDWHASGCIRQPAPRVLILIA